MQRLRTQNTPGVATRPVQIVAGVGICIVALLCFVASFALFTPPKNPGLGIVAGMIALAGSSWVLVKGIRLVFGRPTKGGLMSPTTLRIVAVVVLCLPVAGFFTGYYSKHPILGVLQALAYVSVSFSLRRLARTRSAARDNKDI
jgi:hypothetical protein